MIVGIILAAGKGTRINSKKINKVVYLFSGKPLILYAVELLEGFVDRIIVVVGAFEESVRTALIDKKNVKFARQTKQLGSAHAVKVALEKLGENQPRLILVGMGDHMMFYNKKTIQNLINLHNKEKAVVSFITTKYENPDTLQWGRVERDKSEKVLNIVEHKDASLRQRKIKELNAAFYCFNYDFLLKHIDSIKKSKVTGEYYLTDIIHEAFELKLPIVAMQVDFREVGIGVNRSQDLVESQKLLSIA